MTDEPRNPRPAALMAAGVVCLLAILVTQMALSIRRESLTWDEDDHIFAGYMSWKTADFGLNPEHPPLVKLLATIPILGMPLDVPKLRNRDFKIEAFLDGKEFLAKNATGAMLFRVRMAAALLTVLMALLVFLAASEMFGPAAGFIALALVAFDPNLLAHGAFVTTDMGVSCFLFASVYAFWRYVKAPSPWRLALVGIAAGCALASKHTGILVFPMLALAAAIPVLNDPGSVRANGTTGHRWRESADDRHESGEDDRLAAVFLVKAMRAFEIFLLEIASVRGERLRADVVPQPIVHRIARYGRDAQNREQHAGT